MNHVSNIVVFVGRKLIGQKLYKVTNMDAIDFVANNIYCILGCNAVVLICFILFAISELK